MPESERIALREEVREMFTHGYDNYMRHAFPKDELKPISCQGVINFGNCSMTLIDTLDTLVIMGNISEFRRAVDWIGSNIHWEQDHVISVFETTIRILGGLLAAHLLALEHHPYYNGRLLELALDLGTRMLPAFDTPTGIPFGAVHLQWGVLDNETRITSTACAGTLLLEWGTLARLTGQAIFERVARKAVRAIWTRRSRHGLVGGHINVFSSEWTQRDSGIGTSIDSYYEYLAKSHFLFRDTEALHMFEQGYSTVINKLKRGPWYVEANMLSGQMAWPVYNSLASFWPGLQVLVGDVSEAARTHRAFHKVWRRYGMVPEGFDLATGQVHQGQAGYPLRPELIESTWYLYRATRDPWYLSVGRDFVASIQKHTRVACGFARVVNVETGALADEMDSFMLSETAKYLYLLFDEDNAFTPDKYVFTTEAHPLPIAKLHAIEEELKEAGAGSGWPDQQTHSYSTAHIEGQCAMVPYEMRLGLVDAAAISALDHVVERRGEDEKEVTQKKAVENKKSDKDDDDDDEDEDEDDDEDETVEAEQEEVTPQQMASIFGTKPAAAAAVANNRFQALLMQAFQMLQNLQATSTSTATQPAAAAPLSSVPTADGTPPQQQTGLAQAMLQQLSQQLGQNIQQIQLNSETGAMEIQVKQNEDTDADHRGNDKVVDEVSVETEMNLTGAGVRDTYCPAMRVCGRNKAWWSPISRVCYSEKAKTYYIFCPGLPLESEAAIKVPGMPPGGLAGIFGKCDRCSNPAKPYWNPETQRCFKEKGGYRVEGEWVDVPGTWLFCPAMVADAGMTKMRHSAASAVSEMEGAASAVSEMEGTASAVSEMEGAASAVSENVRDVLSDLSADDLPSDHSSPTTTEHDIPSHDDVAATASEDDVAVTASEDDVVATASEDNVVATVSQDDVASQDKRECTDSEAECADWAAEGYCFFDGGGSETQPSWRNFMAEVCCVTCSRHTTPAEQATATLPQHSAGSEDASDDPAESAGPEGDDSESGPSSDTAAAPEGSGSEAEVDSSDSAAAAEVSSADADDEAAIRSEISRLHAALGNGRRSSHQHSEQQQPKIESHNERSSYCPLREVCDVVNFPWWSPISKTCYTEPKKPYYLYCPKRT